MAPIGKLYGFAGNSRFRRALAVATYAGLEVETDPNFTMKDGAWKTPEFLEKFPFGYLPAFEGADGENLQECGAIADYFAALAPNANLVPTEPRALGEVRQWQDFADQEIFVPHGMANKILAGRLPYNKGVFEGIVNQVMGRLETLDKILLKRTYLVGERLTIADIFVASALANAFTGLIDAERRAKIPNTVRFVETVINNPKIASVFANTVFIEKQPQYQAPVKAEKPKKEKAPKAEKPKAEKKPKAKEPESEDEAPLVAEEPKAKNPLDSLPKSSFNLEEWKRQYSNLDTPDALTWFYNNFDQEGFSIWRIDFKYNDELTLTFMSANQITGLMTRWEASRKYLFGSMGVLGKNNDSIITGIVILRGQDAHHVLDVAPDMESYAVQKLDPFNNADDKKFFDGACSWELTVDGKEWADGKNFK